MVPCALEENKMHQSVHVWYLPTTVSHCLHSSDVSKSAARDQVLTSAFQITYCATLSLHVDPLRNYGINTLSRPMLACLLRAETSLQNNLNMMGSNCFSAGLGTKVTEKSGDRRSTSCSRHLHTFKRSCAEVCACCTTLSPTL